MSEAGKLKAKSATTKHFPRDRKVKDLLYHTFLEGAAHIFLFPFDRSFE